LDVERRHKATSMRCSGAMRQRFDKRNAAKSTRERDFVVAMIYSGE
jgi:hypothetical protein